jgi:hypothetical protein
MAEGEGVEPFSFKSLVFKTSCPPLSATLHRSPPTKVHGAGETGDLLSLLVHARGIEPLTPSL